MSEDFYVAHRNDRKKLRKTINLPRDDEIYFLVHGNNISFRRLLLCVVKTGC